MRSIVLVVLAVLAFSHAPAATAAPCPTLPIDYAEVVNIVGGMWQAWDTLTINQYVQNWNSTFFTQQATAFTTTWFTPNLVWTIVPYTIANSQATLLEFIQIGRLSNSDHGELHVFSLPVVDCTNPLSYSVTALSAGFIHPGVAAGVALDSMAVSPQKMVMTVTRASLLSPFFISTVTQNPTGIFEVANSTEAWAPIVI